MIKKFLCSLIVMTITMNFIFVDSKIVLASEPDSREDVSPYLTGIDEDSNIGSGIIDAGEVEDANGTESSTSSTQYGVPVIGFVVGIISRLINVLAMQVDILLADLGHSEVVSGVDGDSNDNFWITMDKIVFNRVALFDINYLNIPDSENDTYKVGDATIKVNKNNYLIKKQVASMYYVCRMIALMLSLVVLIYIGIRMVISTVASDQARYKKMLISWFESILVLAFMMYIMAFLLNLGNALTGIFLKMRNNLMGKEVFQGGGKYGIFEDTVRENTINMILNSSGMELALWTIVYIAMLFMIFKFFWMYLKRFLMVGFLIMISPLITITYSIDKAGDNQAQAFNEWMKEFAMNVLIQPLHALLYLIFIFSANGIAINAPLVGIVFMYAMVQGEKIVKRIVKIGNGGLMTLKGMEGFHLPGHKKGA